jgi:hypothetical protein
MSRLKQFRNIDRLIKSLQTVIKNQCSLSENDLMVISDAILKLEELKKKKGKTNEQILNEVVQVVELISKYFSKI